jgi:hypothetical protein
LKRRCRNLFFALAQQKEVVVRREIKKMESVEAPPPLALL